MQSLSIRAGLRLLAFLALLFVLTDVAQAQTVVFKQPASVPQSCPLVARMMEAKIIELRNVNSQLASRARQLEIQVAALKVARGTPAKPKRQAQYCKRWKHHRCTWLVRR